MLRRIELERIGIAMGRAGSVKEVQLCVDSVINNFDELSTTWFLLKHFSLKVPFDPDFHSSPEKELSKSHSFNSVFFTTSIGSPAPLDATGKSTTGRTATALGHFYRRTAGTGPTTVTSSAWTDC